MINNYIMQIIMKSFFRKQQESQKIIFDLLNEYHLLNPRKDWLLNFLDRKFKEFHSISDLAFDQLNDEVNSNPQLIIDVITESFSSDIFMTIVANYKDKIETPIDKMGKISLLWETSSFLKLGAYLISKRQAPLKSLTEKKAILKYFHSLGLTNDWIDTIRKIRNAKKHRFTIKKGLIILPKTENYEEITVTTINEIEKKLDSIFSWWCTFLWAQCVCIPKFGILVIYSIFSKIKHNEDFLKEFVKGLSEFYPKAFSQKKELTPKEKIRKKIKRFKKKIRYHMKSLFRKDPAQMFFDKNAEFIYNRIYYHSKDISKELKNISENLTNIKDKAELEKISTWFGKLIPHIESEIF